jgi:beta-glucosidase
VFRKFTTACRIEGPATPLYPFGHGLTYGTVEYGPLRLDKTELLGEADLLNASIAVRNTGDRPVEEIVQLYIGDPVASRSRPVRELRHYRKVALAPGESAEVAFAVTVADLRFFRADRLAEPEHLWEPGRFVIAVGRSSDDLADASIEWRTGEA